MGLMFSHTQQISKLTTQQVFLSLIYHLWRKMAIWRLKQYLNYVRGLNIHETILIKKTNAGYFSTHLLSKYIFPSEKPTLISSSHLMKSVVSTTNCTPSTVSLKGSMMWNSQTERFGLKGGCSNIFRRTCSNFCWIKAALCERTLSWKRMKYFTDKSLYAHLTSINNLK